MSCDVGKATERLENDLWHRWSDGKFGEWAELILQLFSSVYLRRNSFSNRSVALPTPQLILQPFPCFTYATAHSPAFPLLHLRHSSFSNPCIASPTSQALHIYLASRPWLTINLKKVSSRKYYFICYLNSNNSSYMIQDNYKVFIWFRESIEQ